ncbi:MAG TPA: hypothetical protein VHL11_18360, partial [Phototrophicaceae bacterium]|nr:hypothetical protein [Phototrophicaceae bacterium]
MSATRFSLEHFYYGQTVSDNQPQGRAVLLASTGAITPEIAAAAVEHVTLPVGQRPVWAIVRGNRQLPFLMVHTQRGTARQLMSHYILFPSDALRAIGGNLRFLMTLIPAELPTYASADAKLAPLEIIIPDPESDAQQIEDILELMTITHNRMEVMENLLTAIVRNASIVVKNAPVDQKQQLNFISGLLALLPPSVRFAVTFATHSLAASNLDVQIRFYGDEAPPANAVIYQWDEGTLSGQAVAEDDYSRFVISQLRLDTSLVIAGTRALTQMAGWRMKQGDRLGDALAYGSHRQRLDTALLNNQPVSKDDIAKILSEDPTLDENLRVLYGRHLLTFSLAMDDIQHADPLIEFLASTPELEQAAYKQMSDALENRQAATVYRMIAHWLAGVNLQDSEKWINLAHRAASTRLDELITNESIDPLNLFTGELLEADPAVHLERVSSKLLEKVLPLTRQDATLAENAFLLAAEYMDTPRFKRLLEIKPFTSQLDPGVTRLLGYLNGGDTRIAASGLMLTVAKTFGEQWESLILMRFAEMARQTGRFDMLDEATLQGVAQLAASPLAEQHYERLYLISARLSESELTLIGAKAARYLLQIRLAVGDYSELATQMLQQSTGLYRGDLQIDYIKMVEQVFASTKITSQQITTALSEIYQNGIKSAPLIMASIGALQNRPPDALLRKTAEEIAHALLNEPRILNVVPAQSILRLLDFHVKDNDPESAIQVAGLVSTAAASSTEGGTKITGE